MNCLPKNKWHIISMKKHIKVENEVLIKRYVKEIKIYPNRPIEHKLLNKHGKIIPNAI